MTEKIADLNKWLDAKQLASQSNELLLEHPIEIFRRLVMPKDLNPATVLFGGTMLAWIDEAAALYAMCQLSTPRVVTRAISAIEFKKPIPLSSFVQLYAHNVKVGNSSLEVEINVFCKQLDKDVSISNAPYVTARLVFVSVDSLGNKINHGKKA